MSHSARTSNLSLNRILLNRVFALERETGELDGRSLAMNLCCW